MSDPVNLTYLESFYIEDDSNDVDTVHVALAGRRESGDPIEVFKFTFTGDVLYASGRQDGDLQLPQSEDFLQQFAAILGYRVVKGPE